MTEPDPAPKRPRPLYVAFEGGGAKGVLHVGALRAIETLNPDYRGFSGTSAGAIVAALAAAGFNARRIIDTTPGAEKTLLSELGPGFNSVTDLLGRGNWRAIQRLRWLGSAWGMALSSLLALAGVVSTLLVAGQGFCPGLLTALAWLLLGAVLGLRLYRGAANLGQFRDAMDQALALGLPKASRPVCFKEFGRGDVPSLKIVATNITERRMEVFSPERTPDVAVADAVAASVCIPLVFRPWSFNFRAYLDGGLVSNLPAWVFDEERALNPEAMTIALEIKDAPASSGGLPTGWLIPAVRTAVFGHSGLNKRVSGPMVVMPLESDLGLVQFDAPLRTDTPGAVSVCGEVDKAYEATHAYLTKRVVEIPDSLEFAARGIHEFLRDELLDANTPLAEPGTEMRVRVAFAIAPRDNSFSLRLSYGQGFKGEPDTGMLLPIEGTWLGAAYRSRQSILVDRTRIEASRRDIASCTPSVQRVISRGWAEMAWSLSVPMPLNGPGDPWLVVTIDCDSALDIANPAAIRDFQDLIERTIGSIFTPLFEDLRDPELVRS